ncbi:MAG: pantoate--beta-alanine ligase [Saprospiraceae bacterium]|nr:pantoate--beta-alanine ligase [Saprospiraceae bacterium]
MWIFRHHKNLSGHLTFRRTSGDLIGFVPTMGALHKGHLALIRQAMRECGAAVCSIFVNPTQFNDPADLERYPRTTGRDIGMLTATGCQVLYLPAVTEIYPGKTNPAAVPLRGTALDPGPLATVMEGAFRPGHFDGVMQVVHRLLDLVRPDCLYMGQKDYQQVSMIRFLLQATSSPVRLVMSPTVREADGLAMSSRNALLTPADRRRAPSIADTLSWTGTVLNQLPPRAIEAEAMERLRRAGLEPEYVSLADGFTLQPVEDPARHAVIVACAAARAGKVRLIDNLLLKGHPDLAVELS